jgi:uncharacterized protein (TIGR03382 family)
MGAGTYQVAVLIEDTHTHRSRNVRFGWVTVGPTTGGPSITQHPQAVTVTEGQSATFAVTASGSAPLSYQWQRDGSNISGATAASYTLSITEMSDDGATFRCRVTNDAGSATSNSATLTVVEQGGSNDAGSGVDASDSGNDAAPGGDGGARGDDLAVPGGEPQSGADAGPTGDSGGHGNALDHRLVGGCSAAPTSPPSPVLLLIGALVAFLRRRAANEDRMRGKDQPRAALGSRHIDH